MMTQNQITLQLDGQSGRLDIVLTDLMPDYSRNQIQRMIKDHLVTVNQVVEKSNFKLTGDEVIRVTIQQSPPLEIVPEEIDLDVRYEDDDVLVINKPQGLVVHPSKGHTSGTLVNGLVYYLGDSVSHRNNPIRPGLVHRIDKDTSGLILIAKNDASHRILSDQLHDRRLGRVYTALVNQPLDVLEGLIELPIGRHPNQRQRFTVTSDGKPAITHFKLLTNYQDAALVQASLQTGRTHQIRVHFEYIGHPIVGDPVYRHGLANIHSQIARFDEGQYLHASELHFEHPKTSELVTVTAPLPDRFNQVLRTLVPLSSDYN